MRKLAVSGWFAELRRANQGFALPMVLGVILILSIMVVGLAAQVRSELKAGSLEPDVAQAQALIWSGFNEATQGAINHPSSDPNPYGSTAPDPLLAMPANWTPCTPPLPAPNYCVDILKRTTKSVTIGNTPVSAAVVPVAVRWRVRDSDSPHATYGWLIIKNIGNVVTVYYNHSWCRAKVPWDPSDFCEQGG